MALLAAILALFPALASAVHPKCRDSTDGSISASVKAASALERHALTGSHGDVCRNPETRGFFCPEGCEHSEEVPYCVEAICGRITPCRWESFFGR